MKHVSLMDYAAKHPGQETPEEKEAIEQAAHDYQQREYERGEVSRLKESILYQLEKGEKPQYVLYTALEALGLATHDIEWADKGQAMLDNVYESLQQQSFFNENERMEAEKLKETLEDFKEKTRRQMLKNINNCQRLERGFSDIIKAINSMGDHPEENEINQG